MKTGNAPERTGVDFPESAVNLERFRRPLLEYLTSNLDHPDKWVRCMAADILGALGDTKAIGSLMALTSDRDQDLQGLALRSLERMENFPVEPLKAGTAGCDCCLIRSIAEEALEQLRIWNSCRSVR